MSEVSESATKSSAGSRAWSIAPLGLSIALGVLAGLGAYTFSYAEGLSYFSTNPEACVNCHIMQPQYDSWQKASHHTSAVCVDCHLPDDFVPKYIAKAENGWRHGKLFTTGGFKEPVEIQPMGRRILQDNCVRCHQDLTSEMHNHGVGVSSHEKNDVTDCIHCHVTVGHGVRAALGGPLTPEERVQESNKSP
jgi:cytochrome c nitrite reductase small subunit